MIASVSPAVHTIESVVGALVAFVVFGVIPRRASTTMVDGRPDEAPQMRLIGNAGWTESWWPMASPWPFVSLEVYSWGLRVAASTRALRWMLPVTEIRWSDIRVAKLVWGGRIRLYRGTARHGSITFGKSMLSFVAGVPQDLVQALLDHGVPVEGG